MDKLNENAKQVLELLNVITKEAGAFRVKNICWKNDKKLELQCNVVSLRKFIYKNNLEYRKVNVYDYYKIDTADHRKKIIVESENLRLFAIE